jgi:uncharacterized protein (DUF362 family)
MGKNTSKVVVAASQGAYRNTRDALEQLDLSLVRDKHVLIKPNAGRIAQPNTGINTSPEAVAGCADALLEAGAAKISIGESPILGVDPIEAFKSCGISAVAEERNIELIDLDSEGPEAVALHKGTVIDSIKICRKIRDFDVIVSLAVMKMHMHTGVTLSIKNIKGMLYKKEKVRLHQLPGEETGDGVKPLDLAIADLLEVLRPDIAVVDGWTGLEGLGPSAGTPKRLDAAVASLDPIAADAVACRLMGVDPLSIPHISAAAQKGEEAADLDAIQVTPDDYERFASPFEKPPTNIALAFPDVLLYEAGACSACLSTTMLFLQRFQNDISEYRLKDGKLHLVLGKDVEDVPEGTIVIGNCAARHKDRGPFVKGCPPVASRIYKAVTGKEPAGPVP